MSAAQTARTKATEQFKPTPYADGKTGTSIGYGFHMTAWPDKAREIQVPITRATADELFRYVDGWNATYLAKKLGDGDDDGGSVVDAWNGLDQRQVDALLSLAYNAGAPGLWREVGGALKAGDFEAVARKIEGYALGGNLGGKRVDLSSRRGADAELFRAGSGGV